MSDKRQVFMGTVVANGEVAPGHFLMSVSVPEGFPRPRPGQFVMVKPKTRSDLLLPRPFSIYGFTSSRDNRTIMLFYRVIGKGTEQISLLTAGALINVIGPLGSSFTVPEDAKRILLVAGGMGIAPLTYLASSINTGEFDRAGIQKREVVGYIGAQSADRLIGIEELQENCSQVKVSTDDGSIGCSGVVTDMLLTELADHGGSETALYACGPESMLKCLAEMLVNKSIFSQVSVEQRMACGIGACLGCAVRVKNGNGEFDYKRACKDGPVFSISDIAFEE